MTFVRGLDAGEEGENPFFLPLERPAGETFFFFFLSIRPDDVFSYNTQKIVMVRDRRLGLLYYGGLCCIVLYILFYNVKSPWSYFYLSPG